MKLVDRTLAPSRGSSINRVLRAASWFAWINVPPIPAGWAVSDVWKIRMKGDVVDIYSVPKFVVGENIAWLFVV
jgi:hypothetical protein